MNPYGGGVQGGGDAMQMMQQEAQFYVDFVNKYVFSLTIRWIPMKD